MIIIKKKLPEGVSNKLKEKEAQGSLGRFPKSHEKIQSKVGKQKKSLLSIVNSSQHQQMIDWITKVNKKLII